MKTIVSTDIREIMKACQRPQIESKDLSALIEDVFQKVEMLGDSALFEYTQRYDGVKLKTFAQNTSEIEGAHNAIGSDLKSSIDKAYGNIIKFHKSQIIASSKIETSPGVLCWQENRPIERIGIYIPGGTAPLFSTVLMLAGPAQLAGCKEIILCTPPDNNGNINPAILYAANLTGVTQVFKVGGAQAIAALTFGTESIPAVYKIFGPGNQYVTAAKVKAQQFGLAIDMPAGPSELMVLADESADLSFVASDLLSQAEHGIDSQVICVVSALSQAEELEKLLEDQLKNLPRKKIARLALDNSSIIVCDDSERRLQIVNSYAPEHLILAVDNYNELIPKIFNAGSVFLGNYSPESAGDYASGTNHTLPTSGAAKAFSGVNMDAFIKKITFQEISAEGLKDLGSVIEVMAEAEDLLAHKNAVTIRLKQLSK